MYAWDATRDKSATLYIFESWPGFAVLCMNAFLLLNFWVLTFRSFVFEKRKPKKIFYRNFVILYTAWYAAARAFVKRPERCDICW